MTVNKYRDIIWYCGRMTGWVTSQQVTSLFLGLTTLTTVIPPCNKDSMSLSSALAKERFLGGFLTLPAFVLRSSVLKKNMYITMRTRR